MHICNHLKETPGIILEHMILNIQSAKMFTEHTIPVNIY